MPTQRIKSGGRPQLAPAGKTRLARGPDRSMPRLPAAIKPIGLSAAGVTTLLPSAAYPFRLLPGFQRHFRVHVPAGLTTLTVTSSHDFCLARENLPSDGNMGPEVKLVGSPFSLGFWMREVSQPAAGFWYVTVYGDPDANDIGYVTAYHDKWNTWGVPRCGRALRPQAQRVR